MTIDKIDPVFAETATLIDTDAELNTWAGNGYVDERVWCEGLNKVFNRIESKINEMLDKGPKPWNNSATMNTILTKIHSAETSGTFGYDPHNEMDSGDASDEFVDIALSVIDGSRKAICLDYTTALNVEIFDIDSLSYEGPQTIPTESLPQDSGNEDWRASAIICDLNYAYIIFQDNGASSSYYHDHYVQAYNLSDWTVKTGWPSTGLFLFDNGVIQSPANMIFANSQLLAIYDEEVSISAGTDRAVILVDISDGTEYSHGAGDTATGSVNKICSNGEYVFISTGTRIGSMSIASPSYGCGGTGWPRNVSGSSGLDCLGNIIVGCTNTDVYILHIDNANIATISPIDTSIISGMGNIVTDGLNFWVRGRRVVGSTTRNGFMYKLKIYGLMQENSTTPEAAADECFECFSISREDGAYQSRIIFDGDGIVGILDFNGDGRLFKLPKTAMR